MLFAAVFRG